MTSPEQFRTIKVRLRFPPGARFPSGALLRMKIEDVSAADRRSTTIAQETKPLDHDHEAVIKVPAGLVEDRASYSLFVHVDENGSGQIESGDFISPEVHPVLTHGAPDRVDVRLVPVGR